MVQAKPECQFQAFSISDVGWNVPPRRRIKVVIIQSECEQEGSVRQTTRLKYGSFSKLNQIRWISEILQPNKVFLDASSTNKSIKNTNTPCFIIRPTSSCTTKRLLSDHSTSTFFVVVHVTCRVTQLVSCRQECMTIRSETKKEKD